MNRELKKAGITFYIDKDKKVYVQGLKNVTLFRGAGKTYKKVCQEATEFLGTKTDSELKRAYNNCLKRERQTRFFDKARPLFKKIFGFDIPVCRIGLMLGTKSIDPVRFDKLVGTPSGVSTYNFVKKQYGSIGYRLLKKLI